MPNCYIIYRANLGFISRADVDMHVTALRNMFVAYMYVYILIVCSKCGIVGSFLACIYPFRETIFFIHQVFMRNNNFFLIHRTFREITLCQRYW